MKIDIDDIQKELEETKKLICQDLSDKELSEVDIFIDGLLEDLQNSFKKIDTLSLYKKIKQYMKEKENV